MPGTIQVTVLEFKGVSSSLQPSAKSLKVSMGKKFYQTWDKGDFSFPITKLREDLVVALLDAAGNEIVRTDIKTMQIIEKGSWDEVFSLGGGGGGHVHMKLQFILSDEERQRIRTVRESAMKKKHEMNPSINLRSVSSTGDLSETSFTQSVQNFSDRSQGAAVSVRNEIETESSQVPGRLPEKIVPQLPFDNIRSNMPEGTSPKPSASAISTKNSLAPPMIKDDPILRSQIKHPEKRTPSSVRKMISAFETSQLQEPTSLRKAQSVESHLNRMGKAVQLEGLQPKVPYQPSDRGLRKYKNFPSENLHPTTTIVRKDIVPRNLELSQASKGLEPSVLPGTSRRIASAIENIFGAGSREMIVKRNGTSSLDLMRQTTSGTATYSGSTEQLDSASSSTVEKRGTETGLESSTYVNVQVDSNQKPNPLEYYKEEYYSSKSSGMWIFPDNPRRLCITTAGKHLRRISGHRFKEDRPRLEKKISSYSDTLEKNIMAKDQTTCGCPSESGPAGSPDDSSKRLVGQVIKIVVILGFGILVLLTRQKEPRKKNREENADMFTIPDYIDGRRL